MPNGRRRSQRSRAANQRRNRDRDRRSAAAAAAAEVMRASDTVAGHLHHTVVHGAADDVSACPPLSVMYGGNPSEVVKALRRIGDWEIKCSVADCSAVIAALASKGLPAAIVDCLSQLVHGASSCRVIGGAVGHSSLFEMMMASLRKRKLSIPVIADDAVAPLASAFRNTDWDGVDHDVYVAFIHKLKIHNMSEVVVDAIEASYAAAAEASSSSSSSSSDEDEFVDVQEEEDLCRPCVQRYVPDPEPAPCDCHTCCAPTAPALLIKCDTPSACEYTQCIDCIIKGGGGTCDTPGCLRMHYKCPACRGNCGGFGLKLDDDRISKGHVVAMLDDARKMHRAAVEAHMEEMDEIMREMNRRIGELCSTSFGVVRRE
jgi:hypothetical protein